MTLRDKIENHLGLYISGVAIAGFASGIAADRWAKDIFGAPVPAPQCKAEQWEPLAREAQWTPLTQCPAFPIKLQITSPGNGTSFAIDRHRLRTLKIPFVVSASRPLPSISDIGFVVKPSSTPNHFVVFPGVYQIANTNSFRTYEIELPIDVTPGQEYSVRGIFIERKGVLGDRFTSIDQILAADPSIVLTDAVSVVAETTPSDKD